MNCDRFRTVFISDAHLGSRGCNAEVLLSFLKSIDTQTLYLVGDIVDFWRLQSRSYWPSSHNEVVRRILTMVRRGTRVIFVPGNHDEAVRSYVGMNFGGIEIQMQDVHRCLDGRRLLVTHGDQYDLVVMHSRLLSKIGSSAYELLIRFNFLYNRYRRWRGKPYWSLSQYMKSRVKKACTFISNFEDTLIQEAKEKGLDGVVCGHIHHPSHVNEDGFTYLNCGDWIENCTAVVESESGHLSLLHATYFAPKITNDETEKDPMSSAQMASSFICPTREFSGEALTGLKNLDATKN
ncbi:MAG: UDP-2,3-diacylglucosamine hydrolase [Phycisphaerae bacterium]|nr:UDP-2,3-diacylglucosamine hydrolase [Phycisphaerae bacterium]